MRVRKLLVVDDEAINRQMLSDMLGADYEVVEAENGAEAIRIMHQTYRTLSAVILDLMMPVMDGFEALRRMRANPVLARIPVIVATSSRDEDTEIRALTLGASDFVAKPYSPKILSHRLENAIRLRETTAFIRARQKDDLTGIYNREAFFSTAAGMIKAQAPGYYVMACFDIDKFKVINDQYGNKTGNEVLKWVARIFDRGFSPLGGICGRITADDFAILYPRDFMDTEALAEMRRQVARPDAMLQPITFSIGRYVVSDLNLPVSGMYDRALLAQSAAKGRFDRNIVTYNESMREHLLREQRITSEMRNALETGQFEVWFQPQYNHATRALIGAEALVRWRHPDRGLVPPGEFIPVFERNGFIYELDKYVWERACALLRRWMDEGHAPLPVSVNVSRYDALQRDFIRTLTGLVAQYDLPVDLLCIEITESAFSEATDQIIRVVKSLIGYGFTVEIDDFGSGYSSLNTLKDVPAQVLKLDMRFLENSEDSGRGGNVLESVVRMAKWLGMAVIAEGVEKLEQADYLKSIGCTYVQGYLYARPMPGEDYEAHFKGAGQGEKLAALQTVKNLDNNAFWDPGSMDTLIFNSYVGAANIMEYHRGKLELLRVSERFVQMLGSATMSVEDTLKLNWVKHFEQESFTAFRAAVRRSVETNAETMVECVFIELPGGPKKTYLQVTLRVIATAGDHYLVYCTSVNITAQREIEAKERQANELLQAIMSNMNGGVNVSLIRDGAPQVQFANEQYYATRGYTKEQYETEVLHLGKIIHPEDQEMMFNATSTATEPFSLVYRIVRRDGAVRWVINNVTFVRLPGYDEPVQLSVTNDITELREAEEKERASAEQLRVIMANINGGVAIAAMRDGFPRVLLANEQFYAQRGYTKEQYAAELTDPSMILHADDRERVSHLARTAVGPHTAVYRIIRRDGAVRWLQNHVTAVRMFGFDEPVQLLVFNDITEEKLARENPQANDAR